MSEQPRAESESPTISRGARRRQHATLIAAIALLAGGALYAALAIAVRVDTIFFPGNTLTLPGPLAKLPGLDANPAQDAPITDRINILILGLDRRPHHTIDEDGPPRSDSMYVLSIDPVTKSAGVLAIPRDLYVEVPNPQGRGEPWVTRINTAYHYGVFYKYPGGGPGLARETIERTFKLKINYYITLDWVAFADIIDALGGIDITVPETLTNVEAFNVRDANVTSITIPAGRQTMDSITALAYSRHRGDAGGDLARIRRQQQVMQAAMDKALSLGWLSSAPGIWNKYRGAFDTDITAARLPGFLALARQIGVDRLAMVSLAGDQGDAVREVRTPYGEDVLLPVWEKVVPLVQSVIWDRRLREDGARIKVVNGSTIRGQSARTTLLLTRDGIAPADINGVEGEPTDRRTDTVIYDYAGKDYTARKIAEWLGLRPSAVKHPAAQPGRDPADPDIVVILGQDLKLPPDLVAGAAAVR